jgi:hypothetical protein
MTGSFTMKKSGLLVDKILILELGESQPCSKVGHSYGMGKSNSTENKQNGV